MEVGLLLKELGDWFKAALSIIAVVFVYMLFLAFIFKLSMAAGICIVILSAIALIGGLIILYDNV